NTAYGVERVVRDAFARAQARPRRKLTLVHKNNVLVHAGHLWSRTVEAVARDFPDVGTDYLHVDAATIFLVTDPGRFDVIVTDNLFGDIITDLAAAVCGGIGLAASGNIDATRTNPSMFEPVHGRAPRGTSRARASPTRPRRSCRWRFCSHTSVRTTPPHASTRPSSITWPRVATKSCPLHRLATGSRPASSASRRTRGA